MSNLPEPPRQPFQGRPVYNQLPIPNQQQPQSQPAWPHTGYPQQSGTNPGYPQQAYPQQPQWGQTPTPQYGYSQQTQFAQNNVLTPPPQFQQMLPNPPKKGFLNQRLSVPIWAILLIVVLLISIFATSVYAIGNKFNPVKTLASTSSSSTNGAGTSIPTSIPTSAPAPTSVLAPVGISKVGGTITTEDGLACTFISVQPIQGDDITYPKPGDIFIVVHLKVQNNGNSDYNYFAAHFQVISGTGNGTNSIPVPPSTYTANNYIEFGTLVPGGSFEGDLVFEVAVGDHKAELSWQPDSIGNATANVWNLGL